MNIKSAENHLDSRNAYQGNFLTSHSYCPKCWKPYFDHGFFSIPIEICKCHEEEAKYPSLMGWICPCCHRSVSPYVERCPCTSSVTWGFTTYTISPTTF